MRFIQTLTELSKYRYFCLNRLNRLLDIEHGKFSHQLPNAHFCSNEYLRVNVNDFDRINAQVVCFSHVKMKL